MSYIEMTIGSVPFLGVSYIVFTIHKAVTVNVDHACSQVLTAKIMPCNTAVLIYLNHRVTPSHQQ